MSRAVQSTAAWVGAAGLGVANGVARDLMYKERVGDLAARQISTGTLIAALAGYSHAVERRWPIPTARSAWTIGGIMALVDGGLRVRLRSLRRGRIVDERAAQLRRAQGPPLGLVPISMAILPVTVRALHAKR
jgi:hypothetical protein